MNGKRLKMFAVVVVLSVILVPLFAVPSYSQTVFQTVRILADGSVDPPLAAIERFGDRYVFSGDVYAAIVVERSNIVIDGAGYSLRGPFNGTKTDQWMVGQGPRNAPSSGSLWIIGIDFDVVTKPNNVSIKNVNVRNFYIGMYVWTFNNTVVGNSVTANIVGVLLSGDSNLIARNYLAENEMGAFFGVARPEDAPLNTTVTGNSFVNNSVQFSGCACKLYNQTETVHTWDNGRVGNFWSGYNGSDANRDGVGDTPYVVDPKNVDRYPLMQNALALLAPEAKWPVEVIAAFGVCVFVFVVGIVVNRRTKKPSDSTNARSSGGSEGGSSLPINDKGTG